MSGSVSTGQRDVYLPLCVSFRGGVPVWAGVDFDGSPYMETPDVFDEDSAEWITDQDGALGIEAAGWVGDIIARGFGFRCNACRRPMRGLTVGEGGAYNGACACGGLIEAVPGPARDWWSMFGAARVTDPPVPVSGPVRGHPLTARYRVDGDSPGDVLFNLVAEIERCAAVWAAELADMIGGGTSTSPGSDFVDEVAGWVSARLAELRGAL